MSADPSATRLPPAPTVALASAKRWLPWLVAVTFFMEALDTTILNTAVPTVADALDVEPLSMKAVLSSYTLSLAVFIPISGWMADRFGTRRVYLSAIAPLHAGIAPLRALATNVHVARRLPRAAGLRRSDDGAGRAPRPWCGRSRSPSSCAR